MTYVPVAFDCETHLIRPGVRTPRLVCASWKEKGGQAAMATREDAIKQFEHYLDDPKYLIVGANIVFDVGVMVAAAPHLLDKVFAAYELGRFRDVSVRQALIDIREGLFGYDRTKPSPTSETGYAQLQGRYRVAYLVLYWLGKDISKEKNDPTSPRLRYSEMEGLPLSAYPKEFVDYSLGDADEELEIYLRQEVYAEQTHNPNLEREPEECRAAWSLALMSIWGWRTDPEYVEKIAQAIEKEHVESRTKLLAANLLKIRTCTHKRLENGTIKEEMPDDITPEHIAVVDQLPQDQDWIKPFRNALAKGKKLRFGANKKNLEARVTQAFHGNPPRADKGKPKTDRDTLFESSDELLELYGDTTNIEKLRGTYVPVLRQGTKFPINPEYNVLVESLRTSCGEPNIQNLPARGKYAIRPAFVARPSWGLVSVDYSGVEMVTLAQSNFWLFGYSKMRDAINDKKDCHCILSGTIVDQPYETILQKVKVEKDLFYKNLRQGAKAGNFGFGGFMGAPKFVVAKRKDISEEFPNGIRFCELLGKLQHCGDAGTVVEFRGFPCSPVCKVCVEEAYKIRCGYFAAWPEMEDFRQYVSRIINRSPGKRASLVIPGTKVERGNLAYSEFANGHFQGPAAVGAKRALWRVAKECYYVRSSPLFGCRPVGFVHDEILAQMPLDRLHDGAFRLRDVMVEEMQATCPDVLVQAEPAAALRWYKAMTDVYNKQGKLIPWEPEPTGEVYDSKGKLLHAA